jgi:hypothetical protein
MDQTLPDLETASGLLSPERAAELLKKLRNSASGVQEASPWWIGVRDGLAAVTATTRPRDVDVVIAVLERYRSVESTAVIDDVLALLRDGPASRTLLLEMFEARLLGLGSDLAGDPACEPQAREALEFCTSELESSTGNAVAAAQTAVQEALLRYSHPKVVEILQQVKTIIARGDWSASTTVRQPIILTSCRYDGSFDLSWLDSNTAVRSGGGGASEIVGEKGVIRVELGDVVIKAFDWATGRVRTGYVPGEDYDRVLATLA